MTYKTGLNITTFEAKAIVGLRVGYTEKLLEIKDLKAAIRKTSAQIDGFVFSGTLTPTHIVVAGKRDYEEPGVLIETSIYPRFKQDKETFKENMINFIGRLATELQQERVAIRFSDESIMVETEYCKDPDIS